MSKEYDLYLQQHKTNVKKGFEWITQNIPDWKKWEHDYEWQICIAHDASKNDLDEYDAYDSYFYGGNRSHAVVQDFNRAWLMHIHKNPHHWQHWVLINDDPENGENVLPMDYNYILEMICDWWAFSWKSGNLYEIFKWYDEHKDYMKLHKNTRNTVEDILAKIKKKLDENKQGEVMNDE